MDEASILSTMHLGVPSFEIVQLDAQRWVTGRHVKGLPRRQGHPLKVEPGERISKILAGEWLAAVLVDDDGCVSPAREPSAQRSGLMQLTAQATGMAVATNRRFVGVMEGQVLHRSVTASQEVLWELPYGAVTEIHIMRTRGPLGVKNRGISLTAEDGHAHGLVALQSMTEVEAETGAARKVRDMTATATALARLIFEARSAASSDNRYQAQLQTVRSRGWVPDPDEPDDLMVTIPLPPSSLQPQGDRPEPGWFPDPADASNLRWWDGNGWTDHITLKP